MATFDSTQALELLGKTVSVVERCEQLTTSATGVVTAVIVTAPGSPVLTSILVGSEYFELESSLLTIH